MTTAMEKPQKPARKRRESRSAISLWPPPVNPGEPRPATLDDLRALDQKTIDVFVDFVTSGVPMSAVRQALISEQGLIVPKPVLTQFYQEQARERWEGKIEAAAFDANTILNILKNSDLDFSDALLKGLGQETFRMLTQRNLDCKQIEKFTRLLLQGRAQDIARNKSKATLALQRFKLRQQVKTQTEKALAALAEEVGNDPATHALLDSLCKKLRERGVVRPGATFTAMNDWRPGQRQDGATFEVRGSKVSAATSPNES